MKTVNFMRVRGHVCHQYKMLCTHKLVMDLLAIAK